MSLADARQNVKRANGFTISSAHTALDRPENPDRVGKILRAGMPALRRISRDFLAASGPTLGADPDRSVLTLRVDQSIGAAQYAD